jgi:outer membrane protein assembly factor BamB
MMQLRRLARLFQVVALLSFGATAQGQCFRGPDFAICPTADVMYLNDDGDNTLTALSLSRGTVKWHIPLPKSDSEFNGPVATVDTVAVWSGFPGTEIDAFSAATGNPSWRIETSSGSLAALGHYIFLSDAEHWEALTAVEDRTGKRVWHHSGDRPTAGGAELFDVRDGGLLTDVFAIDVRSGQILRRWPRRWDVSAAVFADKFAVVGTRWASGEPTKLAAYSLPGYGTLWVKDDPQKREVQGLATDTDRVFAALHPNDEPVLQPGEIGLELLDASSGKTIWTKTIMSASTLDGPVGLMQGVAVFVTGDSASSSLVEGFDAATGASKWLVHVNERLVGEVLCVQANCYIEAIATPVHVLAVNAQTGKQSWIRVPTQ